MAFTRRIFTKEFRLNAAKLVVDEHRPAVDVARELDINPKSLYSWVRQYHSGLLQASLDGEDSVSAEQAEIARLRSELQKSRAEVLLLKKIRGVPLEKRPSVRYAFIQTSLEDSELKDIPIAKRCEVLEVSVSGYHAWVKRQRMPVKCKKVISDETVLRQAKIIRNEMKYTPGYRHFKRTVKTTDSNHNMFVYPNLLGRDFAPGTLNRAWVSDITYLPTTQGWGFLATRWELGSRRILGWAMDTPMTTDLVLRALNMAVRTRGSNAVAGTIMHSDRGTQ